MDVEQDKALTAAINAIDQARDQAHATLGEVYRTLDSRFVNQAEDLRAAGRPDGPLVGAVEADHAAIGRRVVDARDMIKDLLGSVGWS